MVSRYPDGKKYTAVHEAKATHAKKNKFGAHKTVLDGVKFDSKKEAKRYIQLKQMEHAGLIADLKLQVPFVLINKSKYGREIKYLADFTYVEDGEMVVEDVKSDATVTPLYRLKKRLVAERYGIVIREIKEKI